MDTCLRIATILILMDKNGVLGGQGWLSMQSMVSQNYSMGPGSTFRTLNECPVIAEFRNLDITTLVFHLTV